eukprot:COSAG02_NODE_3527_length_6612_cov_15.879011_6_plen_57_part_00
MKHSSQITVISVLPTLCIGSVGEGRDDYEFYQCVCPPKPVMKRPETQQYGRDGPPF